MNTATCKRKLSFNDTDNGPSAKRHKVGTKGLTAPKGFGLKTDVRKSTTRTSTSVPLISRTKPNPKPTTTVKAQDASLPKISPQQLTRTVPQEFRLHTAPRSKQLLSSEEIALEKLQNAPKFKARPAPKSVPFKLKPSSKNLTSPVAFVLGKRRPVSLAKGITVQAPTPLVFPPAIQEKVEVFEVVSPPAEQPIEQTTDQPKVEAIETTTPKVEVEIIEVSNPIETTENSSNASAKFIGPMKKPSVQNSNNTTTPKTKPILSNISNIPNQPKYRPPMPSSSAISKSIPHPNNKEIPAMKAPSRPAATRARPPPKAAASLTSRTRTTSIVRTRSAPNQ